MTPEPTIEGVQRRFAAQTARIATERIAAGAAAFYLLGGLGTLFELFFFPARAPHLLATHAICLFVFLGLAIGARTAPERMTLQVIVAANALGLALAGYAAGVGLNTVIHSCTATILLVACVTLFPLGGRGQLLAGLGAVIGYAVAAYGGSASDGVVAYAGSLLLAGYAPSIVGAETIETHRLQAFVRTVELEEIVAVLAQRNEELVAANAARERLVANASHDLRTPLNVIIGYSQLIRDGEFGPIAPDMLEAVDRILANGVEQLHLVEDLLTLSRLELEQVRMELGVVDVAALLRDMHAVAIGLAHGRPIRPVIGEIGAVARSDAAVAVRADGPRLRQVLINLISNAVKYTPSGEVEIGAAVAVGEVCIYVRDTGIGIRPEHLDRVFDPFFQVEGGDVLHSAGLGLAIARSLTEQMGGTIRAEAHHGVGSTFTVCLPRADAQA